jgi:hypothetical protein
MRLLTKETVERLTELEPRQRSSACRLLKSADESRFARQLVLLVEPIGDEESIQMLERLAAGKAKCIEPYVCTAADVALTVVRARIEKAKEEASLLRPSELGNMESGLLRPVMSTRNTGEAVLLRPESGDGIPGQ